MNWPLAGHVKNHDTAKWGQMQYPGPICPIRRPDADPLPMGAVSMRLTCDMRTHRAAYVGLVVPNLD